MNEFIRNENDPQTMPSLMASNVFGFKESSAYRKLRDYELDIPGVVFGAFAEYLTHLHEQEFMGSDHGKIQTAISSAHEMVEILASSSNPAIRALLMDEIYENIDCAPEVMEDINARFKPNALALYRRWRGKSAA